MATSEFICESDILKCVSAILILEALEEEHRKPRGKLANGLRGAMKKGLTIT